MKLLTIATLTAATVRLFLAPSGAILIKVTPGGGHLATEALVARDDAIRAVVAGRGIRVGGATVPPSTIAKGLLRVPLLLGA